MKLTSYTNFAMRSLQLAAIKSPELGKAGYLETVRGAAVASGLCATPKTLSSGKLCA